MLYSHSWPQLYVKYECWKPSGRLIYGVDNTMLRMSIVINMKLSREALWICRLPPISSCGNWKRFYLYYVVNLVWLSLDICVPLPLWMPHCNAYCRMSCFYWGQECTLTLQPSRNAFIITVTHWNRLSRLKRCIIRSSIKKMTTLFVRFVYKICNSDIAYSKDELPIIVLRKWKYIHVYVHNCIRNYHNSMKMLAR